MNEYRIPASDARAEYIEKKSRFIGQVFLVDSEQAARERLAAVRKEHYDARHHCWCLRLHGGFQRCSDDGEPQGTAGQPMLAVFEREEIENVLCVVTRYFGGVLLGAGGLCRAYAKTAKDALDAAGVAEMRPWTRMQLCCGYPLLERVRQELGRSGCALEDTDYGQEITLRFAVLQAEQAPLCLRLQELSAGRLQPQALETVFRGVRIS